MVRKTTQLGIAFRRARVEGLTEELNLRYVWEKLWKAQDECDEQEDAEFEGT